MAGWSWEATLGMGSPSDHRCIPIRVRSPTPYPNLACFVDQAAFVLGFVPTTSLQQMAGVVANALCITSQTQIELNLDSAEAIATPAEVSLPTETHDWGRVHIVHETETVGLYHLELSPNGLIPRHIHEHMAETELVVSSGISCQDGRLAPGTILSWPKRTPHLYRNTNASAPASILCVNQPRFDHIDEVVVDESVTNSIQLNEAKRALHYDPWRHMLSHGAEFRFNGAFPGQVVTYFVRDEIRLDADAALVVIADASEVVICQHHKRGWELPGGKRDPGETIQDTAHREALEETGIVLNPELISLGYFIGVGPDSRHIKQVFRASIAKRGDLCSKHEMLDVALVDLVEFASRASSGEPDISFLCRDSVINIIAALVRARI